MTSILYFATALLAVLATTVQAELIYALKLTENGIFTVDSAAPDTVLSGGFVTGLAENGRLVNIDFRPATGELWGLGSLGILYTIDTTTFVATAQGSSVGALSGSEYDIDFNPTVDRIRFVSDADQNLRLNPVTGTLAFTDGNISYGAGNSVNPSVVGAAYTNNFAGTNTTTLYKIDSKLDQLNIQTPPNNGTQVRVGALGVDTSNIVGFDISAQTGTAFAALQPVTEGVSSLYTINLATGAAKRIGKLGGDILVRDIAVVAGPGIVPPTSTTSSSTRASTRTTSRTTTRTTTKATTRAAPATVRSTARATTKTTSTRASTRTTTRRASTRK